MKYTREELVVILEKHNKWLLDHECKDGERANLRGADLEGANLVYANLIGANLTDANLTGANLTDANLKCAELTGANLRDANLEGASMRCAVLSYASLIDANLSVTDLRDTGLTGANLTGAKLRYADLREADLKDTNLTGADLTEADLKYAYLVGVNLRDAYLTNAFIDVDILDAVLPEVCPKNGAFIGWKKVLPPYKATHCKNLIAKLLIPENAKRTNSTTRKCRCDRATVLELQELDGTESEWTSAVSWYDRNFFYTVGQEVYVDDFDEDRRYECTSGIHFFMTREEAVTF